MSQSQRQEVESLQRSSQVSTQSTVRDTPQEPFAKFDDRIAKASDRIFPKQPYLITIPSDKPFRRHANDQTRWYMYTPFSRKEEQLQYMSFLLHQDDDEALMRVDGTRIDEDGKLLPPVQSPRSESQSRPQTPIDTGPKKKISLKDYKTKDKSAVNTPERKPADDMRRQALKSRKEEVEAHLEGKDAPAIYEKKAQPEESNQKSAVSQPKEDTKQLAATSTLQDKDSHRPVKKQRLSAEDNKVPFPKSNGVKVKDDVAGKRALPTLLSPDMPASEKHQAHRGLPDLLSPKLPITLEKAVTAPRPRTDEVKAILKAGIGSPSGASEKKSTDPNSKDSSTGRVRSESQLSVKSSATAKANSPLARPLSSASNRAVLINGQMSSPKPKKECIVVLRYGKKNRKRVQMLLNFEQRSKKKVVPPTSDREKIASKSLPRVESPRPDKKRSTEPIIDVPAKKPKLAASLLEPPTRQVQSSASKPETPGKSPIQSTKQKSTFSTPKKDMKSVAMQRVASSDTIGVRTPSQDTARTSTPLGVGPTSHPKMSPAPTSTPSRSEEYVAWTDINTKVFQIGRALKKDGSRLAAEGKGKEQARGVVLLIEGLVCFMLNSAAQAQARPTADPGWATILPYHYMVWKQSRAYTHLHGLVTQLGAVCRQYLHHELVKRLSRETLPEDHMTSAPTPGSDGATKGTDDNVKKQKTFIELRDELVQNSKEVRNAWLEGPRLLPPNVIEEQYPKTWSRRTKDITKRIPDRIHPKDITKDFYIPIDVTTTVFEASTFALAFLHEWTLIEGVQWKTQVDMGPS